MGYNKCDNCLATSDTRDVICHSCFNELRTELEAMEARMQIYKEYAEEDMCTEKNAIACGRCQEFYKKLTSLTKGGK